jgi:serine protease Do
MQTSRCDSVIYQRALSAMTNDVRVKYGLEVVRVGVVINGIAAGTDAATRGLSPGDVILYVQAEQMQTPQQVQAAIDAARARRQPYVAALVLKKAQDTPNPVWIPLCVTPP